MQILEGEKANTGLAEKGSSLVVQTAWTVAAKLPETIATAISVYSYKLGPRYTNKKGKRERKEEDIEEMEEIK